MTDKEHLEGVKNLIDKYENCYDKEIALKYASDLMRYHARYFVKQAERVQELETYVETATYIQRNLRRENKRYREALEEITTRKMSTFLNQSSMNEHFIQIASKALEESK